MLLFQNEMSNYCKIRGVGRKHGDFRNWREIRQHYVSRIIKEVHKTLQKKKR